MTTLRQILLILAVAVAGISVAAPPQAPVPTLADVEAAYSAYRLDEASSLLDRYVAKRSKVQAARDADTTDVWGNPFNPVESLRERILLARNMLDRVEKVEVIDSVHVPVDEFFAMMRLDPSTGRLLYQDAVAPALPADDSRKAVEPVFSSENGDYMLWVGDDDSRDDVEFTLYESDRLADGSFAEPKALFTRKSLFADGRRGEIYSPFLMADGVTLYFAADGEGSLGGLDIFITRSDGNGNFLQPSNIGLPYNSPANDYMMAIDEVTGLGWWVTDRNAPEGMVTIYLFIPSDLRVNFPADTENLVDYALLEKRYQSDRPQADVRARIDALKNVRRPVVQSEGATVALALPDGRILTDPSRIADRTTRELFAGYIADSRDLAAAEAELQIKREAYAAGNHALASEILSAESDIEQRSKAIRELANDIIRAIQ